MSDKLTVHDPRGYPPKVTGKRLAPRLEGLDGKVVFLVDCLFDNSAVFMEQLQRWFAQHLPTVRIKNIKPATIGINYEPLNGGMIPWYVPKAQQKYTK